MFWCHLLPKRKKFMYNLCPKCFQCAFLAPCYCLLTFCCSLMTLLSLSYSSFCVINDIGWVCYCCWPSTNHPQTKTPHHLSQMYVELGSKICFISFVFFLGFNIFNACFWGHEINFIFIHDFSLIVSSKTLLIHFATTTTQERTHIDKWMNTLLIIMARDELEESICVAFDNGH